MKDILMSNLRYLRACIGMTQEQVAERIFKSPKAYAKYEQGRSEPDIDSLVILSKVFNTTVDDLLTKELNLIKKEGHYYA
jgi:transcriptional regulator with XRE-family HTH domain